MSFEHRSQIYNCFFMFKYYNLFKLSYKMISSKRKFNKSSTYNELHARATPQFFPSISIASFSFYSESILILPLVNQTVFQHVYNTTCRIWVTQWVLTEMSLKCIVLMVAYQSGWTRHRCPSKKLSTSLPLAWTRWISSSYRICIRFKPYGSGYVTTRVNCECGIAVQ